MCIVDIGRPIKPGKPGDLPEILMFSFTQTNFEEWDRRRNFMKNYLLFYLKYIIYLACIFLSAITDCSEKKGTYTQSYNVNDNLRIVSLAPSITETLFALNLGKNIIGVTNFCNYPEQAKKIEKIGTFTDPSFEKIILLRPNLVVLTKENDKAKQFLSEHSIKYLEVESNTISQICHSFLTIGRYCRREKEAQKLVDVFDDISHKKPAVSNTPKILICVGRDGPGSGAIRNVFIAGKSTFYNDLVNLAGGRNCYKNDMPVYPNLSREGILSIKPDIIIDISPAMRSITCGSLKGDWDDLSILPAVKNSEVYCIAKDYATIPGPRITLLLEDIKEIVRKHEEKYTSKEGIPLSTGS